MTNRQRAIAWLGALVVCVTTGAAAQRTTHRPLSAADVDDIARLEMLEDYRTFDDTALARLTTAPHPEVRRRAMLALARLADRRGLALLTNHPLDGDTAVAATAVFAVGQIHDTATVAWLDAVLSDPHTMPTVAAEAAIALGKIKSAAARDALAGFLAAARDVPRQRATVGEALLALGRSAVRVDLAPILKWSRASDVQVRWSAIWALARLKDPAAVATLLAAADDRVALIRSWAVRGLARAQADSAELGRQAATRLLIATRDADRTVRTEATRALASYADSTATAALVAALDTPDSWIAVSAAEGLGTIRSAATIAALVRATDASHPCALRWTARQSLQMFAQDATRPELRAAAHDPALAATMDIAHDPVPYCRTMAAQALRRTTDLPAAGTPARAAVDAILAALPAPAPQARPAPAPLTRVLADYRRIVERWVVPAYNGEPGPSARWDTPRGPIVLDLYAGDAPLAVDDFVRRVESGAVAGTQFTRVVPDFVDQQETIRGGSRIRDEVNRRGLTRGNLAWATAGLDTGNPGYTLGHTPQPHNEGSFTSLGRVVSGMDAVDHIELGDQVTAARMLRGGTPR